MSANLEQKPGDTLLPLSENVGTNEAIPDQTKPIKSLSINTAQFTAFYLLTSLIGVGAMELFCYYSLLNGKADANRMTIKLATLIPDELSYYILATTLLPTSIISTLIAIVALFLSCRGFLNSFSSTRSAQTANLLNRGQLATCIKFVFFQAIGIVASIGLVTIVTFLQRMHSIGTRASIGLHPDSLVSDESYKSFSLDRIAAFFFHVQYTYLIFVPPIVGIFMFYVGIVACFVLDAKGIKSP